MSDADDADICRRNGGHVWIPERFKTVDVGPVVGVVTHAVCVDCGTVKEVNDDA